MLQDEIKKIGASTVETIKENKKVETKSGINPELFEEPPAYVTYSSGLNYSTKKITITRPCKNTDKEIDKTFKKLVKDVEKKLSKMKDTPDNCEVGLTFLDEGEPVLNKKTKELKDILNEGK